MSKSRTSSSIRMRSYPQFLEMSSTAISSGEMKRHDCARNKCCDGVKHGRHCYVLQESQELLGEPQVSAVSSCIFSQRPDKSWWCFCEVERL